MCLVSILVEPLLFALLILLNSTVQAVTISVVKVKTISVCSCSTSCLPECNCVGQVGIAKLWFGQHQPTCDTKSE